MLILFIFSAIAFLVSLTGLTIDLLSNSDSALAHQAFENWNRPLRFAISLCLYSFSLHYGAGFLKEKTFAIKSSYAAALLGGIVLLSSLILQSICSSAGIPLNEAIMTGIGRAAILPAAFADVVLLYSLKKQNCVSSIFEKAFCWGAILAAVGFLPGLLMLAPAEIQHIFNPEASAGNLKIAHFVGLHGLQIIPLIAMIISKSKFKIIESQQTALIGLAGASYLQLTVMLMLQALCGESLLEASPFSQLVFLYWFFASSISCLRILQSKSELHHCRY